MDKAAEREYIKNAGHEHPSPNNVQGVPNESADKVERINKTWSDTNLDGSMDHPKINYSFDRLECRNCGGLSFEVLVTGSYETSARCDKCGFYYIVHCG